MSYEIDVPMKAADCHVLSLGTNVDPYVVFPNWYDLDTYGFSGYPQPVVVTPDAANSVWFPPERQILGSGGGPGLPPADVDTIWSSSPPAGQTEVILLWWTFTIPSGTIDPYSPILQNITGYGSGKVNTPSSGLVALLPVLNDRASVEPLERVALNGVVGGTNTIVMAVNWRLPQNAAATFLSTPWVGLKLRFRYESPRGRSTAQIIG